jgi:hypothetical protein
MLHHALTVCLALLLSAISLGQTAESKQGAMSAQFKEQALRAFHAIQRLDPDGNFKAHPAHLAVNGLLDKIKTPLDKEVYDILFTWLAELELELEKKATEANPKSWRQWIKAEAECQSEAMFYFGGLTEEGRKETAQKIAQKKCVTTAKELGL